MLWKKPSLLSRRCLVVVLIAISHSVVGCRMSGPSVVITEEDISTLPPQTIAPTSTATTEPPTQTPYPPSIDIPFVAVAAGGWHSLALKNDGTVWAWGENRTGSLGDASTNSRMSPVQVRGLSEVIAVDAGGGQSVALKADGTVWTWGMNYSGELGIGTTTNRLKPVQVEGLPTIIAVAAGGGYCAVLAADGTVWTWGSNDAGELGIGTKVEQHLPVRVPGLVDIIAISAGGEMTLALDKKGNVWAWGWDYDNPEMAMDGGSSVPVQVPGLSNVIAVSAGGAHNLVLQNNGMVWGWGASWAGQVGVILDFDPTLTGNIPWPTRIANFQDVRTIATGAFHSMAIKSDGTLWVWGDHTSGQLGLGRRGASYYSALPIHVPLPEDALQVDGAMYTLVLLCDGTIWAWGRNYYGEFGDGTNKNRNSPVQVIGLEVED